MCIRDSNYIQPGVKLNVSSLTNYLRDIPGSGLRPVLLSTSILGRTAPGGSSRDWPNQAVMKDLPTGRCAGKLARRNNSRQGRRCLASIPVSYTHLRAHE